jgi:hypothetical protein
VPRQRDDVDLTNYQLTLNGEQFVMYQDNNMILLATEQNLKLLSDTNTVYMDGTFKSAPAIYSQLYTIHATYRGHVIPAVYCLLPDKTRQTYHTVFSHIVNKMADLGLTFNPTTIISDFESGLIPAISTNFPNALHHGCFFHHTSAIWKNIQRLGLQREYEEDPHVRRSACNMMALAFLPTDKIMATFEQLQQQPVVTLNDKLQELFTYYQHTWLTGDFPMDMWNVHQSAIRTNNIVEGWHSKLNRYVKKIHPNVHQLIKVLQKEQAMTQVTIQRARLGGAPPPRRAKYVRIDAEVERLTASYARGEIGEMPLVTGLRRVIHHY